MRLLLVDDHAAFRQPLAFMLGREPDLAVVAQAGTLAEARQSLAGVDLALVDLDLPDGNGIDLIQDLRRHNPAAMVLVLTGTRDRRTLAQAVEAGAAGYLHKSAPIEDVIAAIRRLEAGQYLLTPPEIVDLLRFASAERERDRQAQRALGSLTPREREVLQALADGLSDREIAAQLSISAETVRSHMVNILAKLGVESRLAALVFAVRHGAIRIA